MTTAQKVLTGSAIYLGLGVMTAAYSVYLGANGQPYFAGFGSSGPVMGLFETVFVWPYALVVNLKGG